MLVDKFPQIFLIMLNWNGWKDTKECIDSLREQNYKNITLVVVDNGSSNDCEQIVKYSVDNSLELLELNSVDVDKVSDKIKNAAGFQFVLIRSEENLGFAGGNNLALKCAEANNSEYVFLLNNDTVVEPDSIEKLVNTLVDSDYTAVVPQIRYFQPNDLIWCCGGEINKGFYEYYHYKNQSVQQIPANRSTYDITFATGCALLFKRSEVRYLSDKFFFGEEDFELALRLRKEGKKMACVMDSIIYHKESASINRSSKYINKIYVHKLNRFINIKDYSSVWLPQIVYRSAKFFGLLLFVEKIGLVNSLKFSTKILAQSIKLNKVTKNTFFDILSLDFKK